MKKIVLGLLVIIAVLLVAAAGTPVAYALKTRALAGSGTGIALCSSGGPFPASISFSATSAQGTTTGTYTMIYTSFPTLPTTGTITGGHINHHNYKLDGLRIFDNCTPTTAVPISIEGNCGTGVTITYKVRHSVAGTFMGDVTCTVS